MSGYVAMNEKITSLNSDRISVHKDRCLMVRNRNAGCLRCAQACTTGCISVANDDLVIDMSLCIGCGTCATVCPTCALEARHPTDDELFDACVSRANGAGHSKVSIGCMGSKQGAQSARIQQTGSAVESDCVFVQCLGRVEESLLCGLARRGITEIVLFRGDCEACAHNNGFQAALEVCKTQLRLMEAWNQKFVIRFEKDPESHPAWSKVQDASSAKILAEAEQSASSQDAIREESLSNIMLLAADMWKTARRDETEKPDFTRVMNDGTLSHHLPSRRERIVDSLEAMGKPRAQTITTRLWGHVEIDSSLCISCRMCATFCPTGAIQKFDGADGVIGVDHFPSRCVQCFCCQSICMKGAIKVYPEVDIMEVVEGSSQRHIMNPTFVSADNPHGMWRIDSAKLRDSFPEKLGS